MVEVLERDFFEEDLSAADVIFIYPTPWAEPRTYT